jgi:glycosidase
MLSPTRQIKNIYEINTPVYLEKLSRKYQRPITLASIPDEELDFIQSYGCDSLWAMGVWDRSKIGIEMGLHEKSLMDELRQVLPDFQEKDLIGSAYSISNYRVSDTFGGEDEMTALRDRLHARGMKLILDFVPNHTAFDHEWTKAHPEYYVQGSLFDSLRHPTWYRDTHGKHIARGRDPQFAPWSDVAQLNAFSTEYRRVSVDTLAHIASLCDGVRCDMAMLMTTEIFAKTWANYSKNKPEIEYWQEIISAIRNQSPDFIFIAEAYWDTQAMLVTQGFDYCYDKDLYDHLLTHDLEAARQRTAKFSAIGDHLLHFLENHDEPRAASVLDLHAHRDALEYILSVPGPHLWHDGQFEGYRTKIPVHLGRGPVEQVDPEVAEMYRAELRK